MVQFWIGVGVTLAVEFAVTLSIIVFACYRIQRDDKGEENDETAQIHGC